MISNGTLKESENKKEQEKVAIMTKTYNRRLLIEYNKLMKKSVDELGFTINLAEEGNLRVWKICITITSIGSPALEKQMQKILTLTRG